MEKTVGIGLLLLLGFTLGSCMRKQAEPDEAADPGLNIQANLVFFYYQDLAAAEGFYSGVIGLEKVLDYGFAKIFLISPTSYLGLVDENEGMHKATEPKTVTLAFVTNEVDAWYEYLKTRGVAMRGPISDSSRHPTRGFVAFDPEGYFLEFERFLEHPQNLNLQKRLAFRDSIYPAKVQAPSRPGHLGIRASVFWLYYQDVPRAESFYTENLQSRLLVDQGFAKVYSSSPTGFIGLVDATQGLHRFSEQKAVTIAFITDQVDDWFERLQIRGLEFRHPLGDMEEERVRGFVTYDSGGYFLEFDAFLPHEKNIRILSLLQAGGVDKPVD